MNSNWTRVPRRRLQFGLRSLLLLTLVVATLVHVFAPLPPDEEMLGGTLRVRTSLIPPPPSPIAASQDSQANDPVWDGRWHLYGTSGSLLARGAHDHGVAVGAWEYLRRMAG